MSLSWWHDWGLFYPASYLPENVVVWWEPVVRQSHCCILVYIAKWIRTTVANFYRHLIKFKCRLTGILCYLALFRILLITESFALLFNCSQFLCTHFPHQSTINPRQLTLWSLNHFQSKIWMHCLFIKRLLSIIIANTRR